MNNIYGPVWSFLVLMNFAKLDTLSKLTKQSNLLQETKLDDAQFPFLDGFPTAHAPIDLAGFGERCSRRSEGSPEKILRVTENGHQIDKQDYEEEQLFPIDN